MINFNYFGFLPRNNNSRSCSNTIFNILRTSMHFSTIAILIYFPINYIELFYFLHLHQCSYHHFLNNYILFIFHKIMTPSFPWSLSLLYITSHSNFSDSCLLFLCYCYIFVWLYKFINAHTYNLLRPNIFTSMYMIT